MKKVVLFLITIFLSVSLLYSQELRPFSKLTQLVEKKGGWSYNRKENAVEFHTERKRLGSSFKKELLLFLSNDINKHYNAGMFLSLEYYLNGEKANYEAALLIYHQGLVLIQKSSDQYIKMQEIAFRAFAAILSQKLGYSYLAVYHKSIIVRLLKTKKYGGSFPAIDAEDRKQYNSIQVDPAY